MVFALDIPALLVWFCTAHNITQVSRNIQDRLIPPKPVTLQLK